MTMQRTEWAAPQNDEKGQQNNRSDTHVSKIIEKHVSTGPIAMQSASGYQTYSHFVCFYCVSWYLSTSVTTFTV